MKSLISKMYLKNIKTEITFRDKLLSLDLKSNYSLIGKNFDNESEDYTYLQIMFVLFNGGIINDEDSKPLYVSNSETYNKGLKILKNTQKNIQKVMPDMSAENNFALN